MANLTRKGKIAKLQSGEGKRNPFFSLSKKILTRKKKKHAGLQTTIWTSFTPLAGFEPRDIKNVGNKAGVASTA